MNMRDSPIKSTFSDFLVLFILCPFLMRKNSLLIMYTLNSMYHRFMFRHVRLCLSPPLGMQRRWHNTVLIPVIFLSQVLMPERR